MYVDMSGTSFRLEKKCQNIIEFEITNDKQKTRTLFYM